MDVRAGGISGSSDCPYHFPFFHFRTFFDARLLEVGISGDVSLSVVNLDVKTQVLRLGDACDLPFRRRKDRLVEFCRDVYPQVVLFHGKFLADDSDCRDDVREGIPILAFDIHPAPIFCVKVVLGKRSEVKTVLFNDGGELRGIRFVKSFQNFLDLPLHRGNGIQFGEEKFVFPLLFLQFFVLLLYLPKAEDDGVDGGQFVNEKDSQHEEQYCENSQKPPNEASDFEGSRLSGIGRDDLDDVVFFLQFNPSIFS